MRHPFKTQQYKTLLLYFLLALAIILSYKVIQEIDTVFKYIKQFINIMTPFIYGFLIAYILNLPCGGINKLMLRSKNQFIIKRSKILSIVTTYILFFLILFLTLRLVIPSIYASISFFLANYQTYYNSAQDFIRYVNDLDFISIDLSMNTIMFSIRDFAMQKLPESINALFGVSSALFSGFLAFISSIYILLEKDKFKTFLCRMLKALFSDTFYHITLKYARDLNRNFKQYIFTQTIDGCILGTIVTIELYLLGSPYALILGIMLGVVNYIPYFGSIFGSMVAVIVVALTQSSISAAGITAVILLITQQIDGNVLQPKLMGGSFSLSPLLVIISITIGGAFYGILGMLAAIPIIAVIKNMIDEIIVYYEQKKLETSKDSQT